MIHEAKFRVLGLVALLAIVGCATAQTTVDPCVEAGKTDGFLPHPTNCSLYFACYGNKGYEQACPDGKFFDPVKIVCDVPEKVQCQINNCPPEGIEYLPMPGSCDQYIICIGGVAFNQTCDTGLFFDPVLGECNYANLTDCVVNPCGPPAVPPVLEIHPNPANCSQYIICVEGEANIRDCASGLFFDVVAEKCTVDGVCTVETPTEIPASMNEAELDFW
ncbi:peritrophin-1-like [Anopheles stephensi]|uniref:Chitin-binding type-2 domain-containing protein n=1 Tax=Anopheles stephensi TaxID=30069 RepID=A0A182YIT4_ANOST|nr:peritrophin-1-like [Anopheles stephensi]